VETSGFQVQLAEDEACSTIHGGAMASIKHSQVSAWPQNIAND